MQASLSKRWHALSSGTPGKRFRDRYYRTKRANHSHNVLHMVLRFLAAGVCLAIGVTLAVVPGPAIPFFFIAGALVASDWLWMAKVLDWIEVRARAIFARLKKVWRRLPTWGRVVAMILGGCLSAASTYGFYQLIH